MSEVAHGTQHEFWRPPMNQSASNPALPEVCRRCGTEFMVGAAFCHICGMGRHAESKDRAGMWTRYSGFLRVFEFSRIKAWFGLPMPALCAFLIGCAFVVVALIQGFGKVQDFTDFEAIQLWRIQWLMAACAAFLAGILLKSRKTES